MILSLGEIETLAKKAARGAGNPWGVAEEAGYAARWLAEQGFDPCASLARIIKSNGICCPLRQGVSIADDPQTITLPPIECEVQEPIFLLPFLANCAQEKDWTFHVITDQGSALVNKNATQVTGRLRGVARIETTPQKLATRSLRRRAVVHPDDWAYLDKVAQRTYAPASEASRLKGAGAGLADND